MENYSGEKFLNKLYSDLHMNNEVMHTASKSDNKDEKVKKYLNRLEKVENLALSSKHNGLELLKELYYKKYVIKEEDIPNSYFELQKEIALERGFGHIEIDENMKKEMSKSLIEDQKKSLDIWLDYLINEDSIYPEWFKYYAFQGMLKLGSYDKTKESFNKRTTTTTNIFVELNREALSMTYDNIKSVLQNNEIDDNELNTLIENGSFGKIYSYIIKKLEKSNKDINSNDGIWIKYNQGDNPQKLVDSLQGRGTGWCTAGYETAKKQLDNGDFYVYYTKDSTNEYKQPRIAIRMDGKAKIGEIRGIAEHQNLEADMEKVLKEKLNEFPDKDRYNKKQQDMEKLTKIYKEYKIRELSIDEMRFLYEVDNKIDGFGYMKDPRIKEILNERNIKKDLSLVFDCSEDEISNKKEDILNGKKIIWFYDDLSLNKLTSADGLILPQNISGNLNLSELTSANGLILPQYIGGDLNLNKLKNADALTLPKSIDGNLNLKELAIADSLILPQHIGGNLNLSSLMRAKDLTLPQNIGGSLDLSELKWVDSLTLPQNIGRDLYLYSLSSADGLSFPQNVGGNLNLSSLMRAKDLTLPQHIGGDLWLIKLESTNNLTLPQHIGGDLNLYSLTSADGLTLPKNIDGNLELSSLTNAKGLTLPQNIGKDLLLDKLNSVEGLLNFPQNIGGDLNLGKLLNVDGLTLSKNVGGNLKLSSLTSAKDLTFPQHIGGDLILNGLTNADGLTLPKNIDGSLILNSLTSAKDLTLPQHIGGSLDLYSLTSAKDLTLPQHIGGDLNLYGLTSDDGLTLPKNIGGKLFLCGRIVLSKQINEEIENSRKL